MAVTHDNEVQQVPVSSRVLTTILLATLVLATSPASVSSFQCVGVPPFGRKEAGTRAGKSRHMNHDHDHHAAHWRAMAQTTSLPSAVLRDTEDMSVIANKDESSVGGSSGSARFESFASFLLKTQEEICRQAEATDGGDSRFCFDRWDRSGPSEGFGITRVLEGGQLLEKAACSVSIIHGILTPERAKAMSSRGRAGIDADGGQPYSAAAMSLVFHTASPLVPTFRADVRYLEVEGEGWFGGGADLTPYYLDDREVKDFHLFYKEICDNFDAQAYPRFKKWADDYFYIPMRKEHRGVGGIFFDDLEQLGNGPDTAKNAEAFVREVALGFMPSFLPMAQRRGRQPFTADQRQWQLKRRGRYLEFNLLYDRGVKFGLSGGRVESIMVSAPPLVSWTYNDVPAEGTEEDMLLQVLRSPRDWIS